MIAKNPYYLDALRRRWLSQVGSEVAPELPEAGLLLVQLGMEGSRDFIVSTQLMRVATGVHPFAGDGGALGWEPAQVVSYARRAEAAAAMILGENPALAYWGGLVFDQLCLQPGVASSRVYVETVFAQGLRTAQIASALGRRLKEPLLRTELFRCALLQASGRALLALQFPEYPAFEQRCAQLALPRPAFEFAVRKRWGVSAAQLAAEAGEASGLYEAGGAPQAAASAILSGEQPFLLRSHPQATYLLAATLRLASNVALRPRRVENEQDPVLAQWKGLELRELPVAPGDLVSISQMI